MINQGLFTSKTEMWETPQKLFDQLNDIHHFDCDVCAIAENAKCEKYYTPEINGLVQDWSDNSVCWMNPPYGTEISKWVEKAYNEAQKGIKVVALLPARTDTRWFHDWIYRMYGVDVEFIKGRLKFGNAENSAPFPSMIVTFEQNPFSNV